MNIATDGTVALYDQNWNEISISSDILIRGPLDISLKFNNTDGTSVRYIHGTWKVFTGSEIESV